MRNNENIFDDKEKITIFVPPICLGTTTKKDKFNENKKIIYLPSPVPDVGAGSFGV